MTDAPSFHPREILAALARHEVAYVLIGGVAVQAHGGQRLTQDLDLAIPPDRANYEALAEALREIDARLLGPSGARSATTPSPSVLASGDLWRLQSDHGRLDLMTLPAALGTFEEVQERAHRVRLGELGVLVAARSDLIAMKRQAGRRQDLEDAALLESLADEPPDPPDPI